MNVFEAFPESDKPYEYLEVKTGTPKGDVIVSTQSHNGVFKFRKGVTMSGNIQTTDSTATLHVRPYDYPPAYKFEGNGIRKDGVDYRIAGSTGGNNFETNELEHYRLTLERADYGN